MKFFKYFIIFLVLFVVALELVLRNYFGFCQAVLLKEDKNFEYIAKPNQHLVRFRHKIDYNSLSMRGDEVEKASLKILGFGDSILNGGVLVNNEEVATRIVEDRLSISLKTKVQFLNISAGSWGPDNDFAYLKKYGDFGAKHFFLVVSSHDAYDNMDFGKIVGVNSNYPAEQYPFGIFELFDRYLVKYIHNPLDWFKKSKSEVLGINKQTSESKFNSGFEDFYQYTKAKDIPFTIYLHAETSEINAGSYNNQGQAIIAFAEKHKIDIIKDLENGITSADYSDHIHYNAIGQQKMANLLLSYLKSDSFFTEKIADK
jgi:hypothetical protein